MAYLILKSVKCLILFIEQLGDNIGMNYKDILNYTRTRIAMNILRAASMNV